MTYSEKLKQLYASATVCREEYEGVLMLIHKFHRTNAAPPLSLVALQEEKFASLRKSLSEYFSVITLIAKEKVNPDSQVTDLQSA